MHLDQGQYQALLEIGNLGFKKAADALSILLQKNIELHVPELKTVPFEDMIQVIDDADEIQVVVYLRVHGDTPGKFALFFPLPSAMFIARTLFGNEGEIDMYSDALAQSALMEVGNIVVSSFVTALAERISLVLLPSTPALAIDITGAIVDAILTEDGMFDDEFLLISTVIEGNYLIQGQLLFFPNTGSLEKLLGAIGNDRNY